jgi:hypothetical protein
MSIISHLGHLIIDLLFTKDKISSNEYKFYFNESDLSY